MTAALTLNEKELVILDYIQNHLRTPFLDAVLPVITKFGDSGIGWICLAAVFLIFKKTRHMGITTAVALVIDYALCNLTLKPLVARIRPYEINTAVELLVPRLSDFSFPSGHTAAATAMYCVNKKWGVAALVLAAIIAFSRLYLYVHFPTDVLAGIVVGVVCGIMANMLIEPVRSAKQTAPKLRR